MHKYLKVNYVVVHGILSGLTHIDLSSPDSFHICYTHIYTASTSQWLFGPEKNSFHY